MRIEFGKGLFSSSLKLSAWEWLLEALEEGGPLTALILRGAPGLVVLEVLEKEVQLPLQLLGWSSEDVLPGRSAELELSERGGLALRYTAARSPGFAPREAPPVLSELQEVLLGLDLHPSAEAVLTARSLLEQGHPLEKGLIQTLLPFTERGELKEAQILLSLGFPLKRELIDAVQQLNNRRPGEALFLQAKAELPQDLQELMDAPRWESRGVWGASFERGELFKVLASLLVEERLLEALVNHRGPTLDQSGSELVFALPFLLGDDLHAVWVQIGEAGGGEGEGEGQEKSRGPLRIKLEIPTESWGLIRALLGVSENELAISLQMQRGDLALWQGAAEDLKDELRAFGWRTGSIKIEKTTECGGWEDA